MLPLTSQIWSLIFSEFEIAMMHKLGHLLNLPIKLYPFASEGSDHAPPGLGV